MPMAGNRSAGNGSNWEILLGFSFLFFISLSHGFTNPSDVAAINSLYIALESPLLPGWISSGGDPCGDKWQGVDCEDGPSITSIKIIGANLVGELGDGLDGFSSIKDITLSNNLIGGSIPSNLPVTLINFFLSDNRLTGTIPSTLSSLTQLSAMSLNDNELSGEIPDSFEDLPVLTNLDLSSNNFSGQLPPSMQNLSSLTTLHLQNNQLSGTLDVLQDLPLKDLNVENNLFSGPIPSKLLDIPNFWKDGNPFNSSSVAPVAPPPSVETPPSTLAFFPGPTSGQVPPPPASRRRPPAHAEAPSTGVQTNSSTSRMSSNTRRVVGISIAAVFSFVVLLLVILLLLPRCLRERRESHRTPKRYEIAPETGTRENLRDAGHDVQKASTAPPIWPKPVDQQRTMASIPKLRNEDVSKQNVRGSKRNEYEIDISSFEMDILPPPPPPPPPLPTPPPAIPDEVIVNPITTAGRTSNRASMEPTTSVRAYTIASLQQYTDSFSRENLVGSGMLGSVYQAQLPDGRLVALKKLDQRIANRLKDDEFIDLVNSLDKIRHENVAELVGYCSEHSQRLLVYKFCVKGTLHDALHSDDEYKKNLSWNMRIRIALGAARALKHMHEACEPPIIHRNFKSGNILLDEDVSVLVSDCGLAPLMKSVAVSQLSGQLLTTYGYGAPEFESGIYTTKSDVYSFGVVMLELLTGRMSYDKKRPRGEQFLVRWAIPQLHDIDALSKMIDPALVGKYSGKSLSHFVDIISRCVVSEPEYRPLMSDVVRDLIELIRKGGLNT